MDSPIPQDMLDLAESHGVCLVLEYLLANGTRHLKVCQETGTPTVEDQRYYYLEGNYSCDCNRMLDLARDGVDPCLPANEERNCSRYIELGWVLMRSLDAVTGACTTQAIIFPGEDAELGDDLQAPPVTGERAPAAADQSKAEDLEAEAWARKYPEAPIEVRLNEAAPMPDITLEEALAEQAAWIKQVVDTRRAEFEAWLAQKGVVQPTAATEFVEVWSAFVTETIAEGYIKALQGNDP